MNRDARDAAAGAAGGLVAGAVLSGIMLLLERSGRGPSDLVLMERRAARELGWPDRRPMRAAPDAAEQAVGHAGHLLLSAALGSGLGVLRRGLGTTAPKAGLLLGLGFYPLAFAVLGPLLGLTRPPWRDRPSKVGQNVLMHAVFGAVTGLVADRIERQTGRAARTEPKRAAGGYVRCSDDVETIAPDEEKTFDRIITVMGEGGQITRERYGRSVRTSHAKAHALLKGELRVLDGLSGPLRQGLFAEPRTYPVVVRLSHVPGELLDDRKVSTPRGMAIKIFDAEGPKVAGHEGENTHDFVLDSGAKAFIAGTAGVFLTEIAATEAATPMPQAVKQAVSAVSRAANRALNAVGLDSATLDFYGHPKLHPLVEPYFTQAPIRYGDHIAKLGVFPDTARLRALTEEAFEIGGEDGLRDAVVEFFRANPAEFEVRVQLCTDLDAMPVEDASAEWPEEQSPYRPVARLVLPPQDAWSPARQASVEALSFAPGHSLAAHRPLGSIMRARMKAYAVLGAARRRDNGDPVREPRGIPEVPD